MKICRRLKWMVPKIKALSENSNCILRVKIIFEISSDSQNTKYFLEIYYIFVRLNRFGRFFFNLQLRLQLPNFRAEIHQSKTLLFSKRELAVTNKKLQKIQDIIFNAFHFTIRAAEGVPRAKFKKTL